MPRFASDAEDAYPEVTGKGSCNLWIVLFCVFRLFAGREQTWRVMGLKAHLRMV